MKRYWKVITSTLAILALGVLLCIWFWRPGSFFATPNQGHRLGGDEIATYAENTLEVFREAVSRLESNEEYYYSECDLRETADNRIVIFHDWDMGRLVPDTPGNRNALGVDEIDSSLCLCDFSLNQLLKLRLKGNCQIPTLEKLLQCAAGLDLKKPLLLEIKYFHSDRACTEAIRIAAEYRDSTDMEIHFSAFIRNIKRSTPEPEEWLRQFREAGFRVYQVYRPKTTEYDLCETW